MGLGPRGSSLLAHLGLKKITEIPESELIAIVERWQGERTRKRLVARVTRQLKEGEKRAPKRTKPPPKLEDLGLAPQVIAKLRATGKTDEELVAQMRKAGLI